MSFIKEVKPNSFRSAAKALLFMMSFMYRTQDSRKQFVQPVIQFSSNPVPQIPEGRCFQILIGLTVYACKQQFFGGFVNFGRQKTFQKLHTGRKKSGQKIQGRKEDKRGDKTRLKTPF